MSDSVASDGQFSETLTASSKGKTLRALMLFVLAAAALVGCAQLLRGALFFRADPFKKSKLQHLAEHRDCNAVFIGSSHVYRQIIPSIFDSAASQNSALPIKSFNCGQAAMFPPETYFFADRALSLCRGRMKYLFLEPNAMQLSVPAENRDTLRFIGWHDWPRTREVCAAILQSNLSREEKRKNLIVQSRAWLKRSLALGFGGSLFSALPPEVSALPDFDGLMKKNRGWIPLEAEAAAVSRKTEFQKNIPDYLRRVDALRSPAAASIFPPRRSDVQAIRRLQQRFLKAGVQVIFILPPGILRQDETLQILEKCRPATVFNFVDPDKYAELYDVRNRFDADHLNSGGSEIFTRLLAARFSDYLRSHSAEKESAPDSASRGMR